MIKFKRTTQQNIKALENGYKKSVIAPLDDMWELGIIPKGHYYEIIEGETLGYFVIDENKILLQFFIEEKSKLKVPETFKLLLEELSIKAAMVSTYDPDFLCLCLDHSSKTEIDSILYRETATLNDTTNRNLIESKASLLDYEAVIRYTCDKTDTCGDWAKNYLKALIKKEGLYIYRINDVIVATGEYRPSVSYPSFANLGMTVSKDFRRQGYGSHILSRMKSLANENNLKALCSTDIGNVASQKTIVKSGFYAYHRILKVTF